MRSTKRIPESVETRAARRRFTSLTAAGHGIGPDGAADPFHPAGGQNAEHDNARPGGAAAGGQPVCLNGSWRNKDWAGHSGTLGDWILVVFSARQTTASFVEPADATLPPAAHTNDGFFKAVFSQPAHAAAFFKSHLPAPITAETDWATLCLLPGSFVKSSLQQVHSDLLFSVRIGTEEALLYLLFEHQSTPDPAMPLRLLGYTTEILQQYHKSQGLPLPPVLPFVLHQGPDPWTPSPHFQDLFELPGEAAVDLLPYLPKFQHALLDLSHYDPTTGETDTQLRIVLNLMKLVRQREILKFFAWLVQFPVHALPNDLIGLMLLYALHADSELDAQAIYPILSSNPELKITAMSVAEKLKIEGRVEGKLEGRSEGRVEGRVVGKIQTLEEFLDLPITSDTVLESLSKEALQERHDALRREYQARFKRG